MRYATVCSGIGCPEVAWAHLGWDHAFCSEIDPFASAVLAHRFPSVPNLGDLTKIGAEHAVDLLCGGTPCQSFSVAGRRSGLDDPRGVLAFEFLKLAERLKARWIVFENVPGLISSNNGDDFRAWLDALEAKGYIPDVEILDAQFHGVAQRRRRVFVVAQHRDDLLGRRTPSSALTIAQCLLEILHGVRAVTLSRSESGPPGWACPALSTDGARRKIALFGLLGDGEKN